MPTYTCKHTLRYFSVHWENRNDVCLIRTPSKCAHWCGLSSPIKTYFAGSLKKIPPLGKQITSYPAGEWDTKASKASSSCKAHNFYHKRALRGWAKPRVEHVNDVTFCKTSFGWSRKYWHVKRKTVFFLPLATCVWCCLQRQLLLILASPVGFRAKYYFTWGYNKCLWHDASWNKSKTITSDELTNFQSMK